MGGKEVKSYIDSKVRQAFEWLYNVGVSFIKIDYSKNIAQDGYLLRRTRKVVEEYGITTIYVNEVYTPSKCSIHGGGY